MRIKCLFFLFLILVHVPAKAGFWDLIQLFSPKSLEQTFCKAISSGDLEMANQAIERGVDLDWKDDSGNTFTYLCAFFDRPKILNLLEENNALDKTTRNNKEALPLHIASLKGHVKCMRFLTDEQTIDQTDKIGSTALHHAVFHASNGGSLSAIDFLLSKKANILAENLEGDTPLKLAELAKNKPEIIKILNSKLKKDEEQRRKEAKKAQKENKKQKAEPRPNAIDIPEEPLITTKQEKQQKFAEQLYKQKVEYEEGLEKKELEKKRRKEKKIEAEKKKNERVREQKIFFSLMEQTRKTEEERKAKLTNKKEEKINRLLKIKDGLKNMDGHKKVLQFLDLVSLVRSTQVNHNWESIVISILQEKFTEKFEQFVRDFAANRITKDQFNEVIKWLHCKFKDLGDFKDLNGNNLLHIVIQYRKGENFIDFLVEHGVNINGINNDGDTPVHIAAMLNEDCSILFSKLKRYMPNLKPTNKDKDLPIHIAVLANRKEIFSDLATKETIISPGYNKNTPLHLAANIGDPESVKTLKEIALQNNQGIVIYRNAEGKIPLHLAVIAGKKEVLADLMTKDTLLSKDNHNFTALDWAIIKNQTEIAKILILKMKKLGILEKVLMGISCNSNYSPLHGACRLGRIEIVKFLVQNMSSKTKGLNLLSNEGYTPIHYASVNGHKSIVEYLVKLPDLIVNRREINKSSPWDSCKTALEQKSSLIYSHLNPIIALLDQRYLKDQEDRQKR